VCTGTNAYADAHLCATDSNASATHRNQGSTDSYCRTAYSDGDPTNRRANACGKHYD
jgi:hypothetical protein